MPQPSANKRAHAQSMFPDEIAIGFKPEGVDADKPDQAPLAGFERGFQRAARPQDVIEFYQRRDVMQLDKVKLAGLQPFQGAADLRGRLAAAALPGFGGQEEIPAVLFHPRADPQFGVAVRCGDVDVVHAVPEQNLEGRIRVGAPADSGKRRRAEHGPRGRMACFPERYFFNHGFASALDDRISPITATG